MTVRQITEWADKNTTKMGVGYQGCIVRLSEALWHHLEDEEVNCYQCKVDTPAVLSQACSNHQNTKLGYLVLCTLAQVAKRYKSKAKMVPSRRRTPKVLMSTELALPFRRP